MPLEVLCRCCERTLYLHYDGSGVRMTLCQLCKRKLVAENAVGVPETVRERIVASEQERLAIALTFRWRLKKFGKNGASGDSPISRRRKA